MSLLAMVLFFLVGISLGLIGAGGSILSVPILVYALGIESKQAIATSLLVVGITSATAALQHAIAGNVQLRVALVFSASGMLGAFLGGALARYVSGSGLLVLFALVMITAAVAMWRGGLLGPEYATRVGPDAVSRLRTHLLFAEGLVIGLITGLVGAGGGFLIVPGLVLLSGLPMHHAVGSSLIVIALKSAAGFAGYMSHVQIDYRLALTVSAAAVVGAAVGAFVGRRASAGTLRRGFAVLVFLMAVYVLYREVPSVFS